MNEQMWRAIVDCDPAYDGQFYYGLQTTGIFCKPSCRSKTPNPENVRIFLTTGDAKKAGLRPCKRCRPEEPFRLTSEEELAQKAAAFLTQHCHQPLSLQQIAAELFVSPYHLQRCFQKVMGVSPAKFLLRKRLKAAQHLLGNTQESITTIALQVGFQSSSHFSAVFHKETGCSPTAYRQCQSQGTKKPTASL
ncbi:bifunctional transcriptional activator/DNA repair enzyme AdaA [Brevibacillus sp. H7]|uniref:bifunctional transcriptional activator/DNA repair enzyme AdaA n=1 Tax=Brevibacillus sp. H7 TaxID=3349138 RepID=UPI00380874BB